MKRVPEVGEVVRVEVKAGAGSLGEMGWGTSEAQHCGDHEVVEVMPAPPDDIAHMGWPYDEREVVLRCLPGCPARGVALFAHHPRMTTALQVGVGALRELPEILPSERAALREARAEMLAERTA